MSQKELHDKAIRLLEGGRVEINNLVVGAKLAPEREFSCNCCEMDCLCDNEMCALCNELEMFGGNLHYLFLTNP